VIIPKFSVELDAGIQDGTSITITLCLEKSWGFLPGKITHWLYLKKVYTVKNQFIGLQQIRTIKVTASNIATIQISHC
jgi:hypothetical protein